MAKRKPLGASELLELAKDSAIAWSEDGAASMGAAIAYYTIFSIAPLLIIAIALAGLFFGVDAAQGHVFEQARGLLGEEGAAALQDLVVSAAKPATSIFATITGLALMLFGATGVFVELQGAMDKIWEAPVSKHQSGLWYMVRRRILTFGMVLGVAFVLLVSLVVSALISALQSLWAPWLGAASEIMLQAINFLVSLVIVSGLFAMIFKLLPRVTVAWGDVIIGALVTALLFNIGKFLIGLYIGKSGVASGFGAAGTLVVMLLWVYYSAQIFLLGAEFTWVYAKRHGSKSRSRS